MPAIYMDMNDRYYLSLLHVSGRQKVLDLLALVDGAPERKAISSDAFSRFMPDQKLLKVGVVDDEIAAPPLPPAPQVELRLEDRHMASQMAMQLVARLDVSLMDIKASYIVHCPGGEDVKVLFDNASAGNQRQRAYVRCCDPEHIACFRYRTVELEASPEHAAAVCALWAVQPSYEDFGYSKVQHKQFNPSVVDVNELASRPGAVERV